VTAIQWLDGSCRNLRQRRRLDPMQGRQQFFGHQAHAMQSRGERHAEEMGAKHEMGDPQFFPIGAKLIPAVVRRTDDKAVASQFFQG
jgi:hypothetical protein